MWERIDNHLACHELRLRKSTDQFVRAAISRALAESEASGGGGGGDVGGRRRTRSQSGRKEGGEGMSSNPTTSDFVLLKRTIDDEILMLAKYKLDLVEENKRHMELWKEATRYELWQELEQKMLQVTGASASEQAYKNKENATKLSVAASTTSVRNVSLFCPILFIPLTFDT
jgi:hypothetical protein